MFQHPQKSHVCSSWYIYYFIGAKVLAVYTTFVSSKTITKISVLGGLDL